MMRRREAGAELRLGNSKEWRMGGSVTEAARRPTGCTVPRDEAASKQLCWGRAMGCLSLPEGHRDLNPRSPRARGFDCCPEELRFLNPVPQAACCRISALSWRQVAGGVAGRCPGPPARRWEQQSSPGLPVGGNCWWHAAALPLKGSVS